MAPLEHRLRRVHKDLVEIWNFKDDRKVFGARAHADRVSLTSLLLALIRGWLPLEIEKWSLR